MAAPRGEADAEEALRGGEGAGGADEESGLFGEGEAQEKGREACGADDHAPAEEEARAHAVARVEPDGDKVVLGFFAREHGEEDEADGDEELVGQKGEELRRPLGAHELVRLGSEELSREARCAAGVRGEGP